MADRAAVVIWFAVLAGSLGCYVTKLVG